MAKAKKSKSSKVAGKVEAVKKKSPPKKKAEPKEQTDKEVIDEIASSLEGEYSSIFSIARKNVGDNLINLREEVLKLDGMSQSNYEVIIKEIDKYKMVSE